MKEKDVSTHHKEAVINRDAKFVQALAKEQVEKGANMLDVNAAVSGMKEAENLVLMGKTVQEVVDGSLVLDSSAPTRCSAGC